MHPVTDYIPAIALIVASIVIPKEPPTEDEEEKTPPLAALEVVESQSLANLKLGRRDAERPIIRIEADFLTRPGLSWIKEKPVTNSRWQAVMAAREKRYARDSLDW